MQRRSAEILPGLSTEKRRAIEIGLGTFSALLFSSVVGFFAENWGDFTGIQKAKAKSILIGFYVIALLIVVAYGIRAQSEVTEKDDNKKAKLKIWWFCVLGSAFVVNIFIYFGFIELI